MVTKKDVDLLVKTASPEVCLHFSVDIAQHALNRCLDVLKKPKFQQALDRRRAILLESSLLPTGDRKQCQGADTRGQRHSLLRSVHYYRKKIGHFDQYCNAIHAIVYSGDLLPDHYHTDYLRVVREHGWNTAGYQGMKYPIENLTNGHSEAELVWQFERLEFLIHLSGLTSRFWLLYQEPENMPLEVPETCALDYYPKNPLPDWSDEEEEEYSYQYWEEDDPYYGGEEDDDLL